MRIISQNKEIDIPYERVCVTVYGNRVLAYDTCNTHDSSYWNLGSYQNHERAKEALMEIQDAYARNSPCFYLQ